MPAKQFGHIFTRNDEELKEVFGVKTSPLFLAKRQHSGMTFVLR
jgi:hypothetical protein